MTTDQYPVPEHETRRFWDTWQNSTAHRVLHNEFSMLIAAARTELESANCGTLPAVQGKLKAFQEVLTTINRKGQPL